jgi:hypothetical protein
LKNWRVANAMPEEKIFFVTNSSRAMLRGAILDSCTSNQAEAIRIRM